MKIKIKRLSDKYLDIPLPAYATNGSAGMDLRAAIEHDILLKKGDFCLVPTDLIFEIPEGFEIQVRPRSGLAAKNGIGILNSPGTIDSDYRGEVKVILFNFGGDDFIIKRGDRIAQIVLAMSQKFTLEEVNEISTTNRGDGGFGHTGKA